MSTGSIPPASTADASAVAAPTPTRDERLLNVIERFSYIAAIALLLATAGLGGMIWTDDSRSYVEAVQNGSRTAGYVYWPPVYPIVLRSLTFTGLSIDAAALTLNAVCLFFSMRLVRHILAFLGTQRSTRAAVLWLMAGLHGALQIWQAVWSEPLFILFMLMALYITLQYREERAKSGPFQAAILGMWVSFAAGTRYPGLLLLPIGAMAVLFVPLVLLQDKDGRDPPLRQYFERLGAGLADCCIFLLTALLPTVMWLQYVHGETGTLFGPRELVGGMGFGSTIVLIALAGWGLWSFNCKKGWALSMFLPLYAAALWWGGRYGIDPLGPRLMAPAAIVILMLWFAPRREAPVVRLRFLTPPASTPPASTTPAAPPPSS